MENSKGTEVKAVQSSATSYPGAPQNSTTRPADQTQFVGYAPMDEVSAVSWSRAKSKDHDKVEGWKRAPITKRIKDFVKGPYYKTIPKAYEKASLARNVRSSGKSDHMRFKEVVDDDGFVVDPVTGERFPDFLETIKRIVLNEYDERIKRQAHRSLHASTTAGGSGMPSPGGALGVGGMSEAALEADYGVDRSELVPMPFDAPSIVLYLGEFGASVAMIVNATVVMFLAILVENSDRSWKDKDPKGYQSRWLPLIQTLVYMYPIVTLMAMVVLNLEITIKKFMYYRLLSMRVLIDWENYMVWQGAFFYYFIAFWIMLDAWALYGVIAYWGDQGKGADTQSWTTFLVVNIQTLQLLVQYYRIMTAEKRLVSLNEIFERAPVEAQNLLAYTYIVEEEDVIAECYTFFTQNWRRVFKRMGFYLSCGLLFRRWNEGLQLSYEWDVDKLRELSGNFAQVEEQCGKLRDTVREQLKAMQERGMGKSLSNAYKYSMAREVVVQKVASKQGLEAAAAQPQGGAVENPLFSSPGSASMKHGPQPTIGETEAFAGRMTGDAAVGLRGSAEQEDGGCGCCGPPGQAGTAGPAAEEARGGAVGGCMRALRRAWRTMWWRVYIKVYASLHSIMITLLMHSRSWPFRPDVPYFRLFTVIQFVGMLGAGCIILLGIYATQNQSRCDKGNKSCDQCIQFIKYYKNPTVDPTFNETCILNTNAGGIMGTYNWTSV